MVINYKVTVSYDGSQYCGWQTQHKNNSVQEAIEQALYKLYNEEINITASGRTDAKVHAIGQVFNYYITDKNIEVNKIKQALNTFLPKSIRIKNVAVASDDFHARFSAKSKKYEYYLCKNKDIPFIENYMGKEEKKLDLKQMEQCCTLFIGEHDFTSFTSSKIHELKNRVRTITSLSIEDCGYYYKFTIVGTSFLRYMVRMIVQTIIECGKHNISLNDVQYMIDAKDKEACRYKAEANGLYLAAVYYE